MHGFEVNLYINYESIKFRETAGEWEIKELAKEVL